jgi:hypothetical protein
VKSRENITQEKKNSKGDILVIMNDGDYINDDDCGNVDDSIVMDWLRSLEQTGDTDKTDTTGETDESGDKKKKTKDVSQETEKEISSEETKTWETFGYRKAKTKTGETDTTNETVPTTVPTMDEDLDDDDSDDWLTNDGEGSEAKINSVNAHGSGTTTEELLRLTRPKSNQELLEKAQVIFIPRHDTNVLWNVLRQNIIYIFIYIYIYMYVCIHTHTRTHTLTTLLYRKVRGHKCGNALSIPGKQ